MRSISSSEFLFVQLPQSRDVCHQRQLRRSHQLQRSLPNSQQRPQDVQQPSSVNRKSYLLLHLQRRPERYLLAACNHSLPICEQSPKSSHPYSSYQRRRVPRSFRRESLQRRDLPTNPSHLLELHLYVHGQPSRDGMSHFQVVAQ